MLHDTQERRDCSGLIHIATLCVYVFQPGMDMVVCSVLSQSYVANLLSFASSTVFLLMPPYTRSLGLCVVRLYGKLHHDSHLSLQLACEAVLLSMAYHPYH